MMEIVASLRDALLVILGVFLGALLNSWQARRAIYNQARMKFRAAFLPELAQLLGDAPSTDECATLQFLEASFPRHHTAYIELWASTNRLQRLCLERRWHRYRYGKRPEPFDEPFTYLASTAKEEPDMRKLAIRHIHQLIA
jgi:hypothetical protein